MFENLSERLSQSLRNISGVVALLKTISKTRCAKCAWRCLKLTLLCLWSKEFIGKVKERALGVGGEQET